MELWSNILAIYGPVIKHSNYLWTYDLHVHNAFDAGKSITRANGKGLGPGDQDYFGPCKMASSRQASAIWGPKKSIFPGPNPSHLPK